MTTPFAYSSVAAAHVDLGMPARLEASTWRPRDLRACRGRAYDADALTVGEAAARIGLSASTLRSWDRRYSLTPSGRSPGGHRRYSPDDVDLLRRVHQLIITGETPARAALLARRQADAAWIQPDASDGNGQLRSEELEGRRVPRDAMLPPAPCVSPWAALQYPQASVEHVVDQGAGVAAVDAVAQAAACCLSTVPIHEPEAWLEPQWRSMSTRCPRWSLGRC